MAAEALSTITTSRSASAVCSSTERTARVVSLKSSWVGTITDTRPGTRSETPLATSSQSTHCRPSTTNWKLGDWLVVIRPSALSEAS